MNSVSLFLYFADILSGIQVFFGLGGVITFLGAVIMIGCSLVYEGEWKGQDRILVRPLKFLGPWGVFTLVFAFFMMLTAIAIPSKDTRFAIAASQVGEQIIQLEEVQEVGGEVGGLAKDAISLLRRNIQDQLSEKPVETDKGN